MGARKKRYVSLVLKLLRAESTFRSSPPESQVTHVHVKQVILPGVPNSVTVLVCVEKLN